MGYQGAITSATEVELLTDYGQAQSLTLLLCGKCKGFELRVIHFSLQPQLLLYLEYQIEHMMDKPIVL